MDYRLGSSNLDRSEVKAQKRAEAEERNKAYQALPLEEKLARNSEGGKVQKKLLAKVK